MDDAEQCDNVIIFANKKIVAQGPPSKLEKMLPGGGKVINIILDNVTDDLLFKIQRISGVKKVIRDGRNLRILTDHPNAVKLGQDIDSVGGIVNETRIDRATMMEVFVYYTGEQIKD
jgi:ABC-type multidrug transport system ATPase subunit